MPNPTDPTIGEPAVQSIPDQILEAVSIDNVKTIGASLSHSAALAAQNAVASQQQLNAIANASIQAGFSILHAITGKVAELIVSTDISEAAGLTALAQQAQKGAGNTPPVTP